jgi:hypothetical protein
LAHLKVLVLAAVRTVLESRITLARTAMEEAQAAANSEEKSSAGDKYETSRAMSQNQRDLNARQLLEARNAVHNLELCEGNGPFKKAFPGALIRTTDMLYFMGPGLGKLTLEDGTVFISMSAQAPMGQLLQGKKVGDKFLFQGKKGEILEIS